MTDLVIDLDRIPVAGWEWLVAVRALTIVVWLLVFWRRREPHPIGLMLRMGALGLMGVLTVDSIGISRSEEPLTWGALGRDLPLILIAYALCASARVRRQSPEERGGTVRA